MKRSPGTQAGFSLIELLVAMSVMLVVLGVSSALMKDSLTVSTTTHEVTEAQQSLRIAHDYMAGDLGRVGDGTRMMTDIRLPVQFVRDNMSSRTAAALDPDNDGYVQLNSVFADNNSPAGATIRAQTGTMPLMAGQDRLTLLLADRDFDPVSLLPGSITNSGANVSIPAGTSDRFEEDEIYFFNCGGYGAFGAVTNIGGNDENGNGNLIFASSDPYGLNDPGNGGPISTASDRGNRACTLSRVNIIHYFVNADGLLFKRFINGGGGGFRDVVIAEHMTGLQFRYSLNQPNGIQIMDQPTTPAEAAAVRMVDVAAEFETAHRVAGGRKTRVRSASQTALRNMEYSPAD